jgi:mono/diheme cytochrome c family protein
MKRISGVGLTVAMLVVLAVADGTARAQDFTAGKTPAQLFASDCSACHRNTAGLAKGRDARALSSFLREHYTTKPESAGALAAYVASGITRRCRARRPRLRRPQSVRPPNAGAGTKP